MINMSSKQYDKHVASILSCKHCCNTKIKIIKSRAKNKKNRSISEMLLPCSVMLAMKSSCKAWQDAVNPRVDPTERRINFLTQDCCLCSAPFTTVSTWKNEWNHQSSSGMKILLYSSLTVPKSINYIPLYCMYSSCTDQWIVKHPPCNAV